jgi:GT2 family glycosyltransferase
MHRHDIPIYYDPRIPFAHKVSTLTGGPQSPFSVRHDSRNQIYFLRKHFSPWVVAANVAWIRFKNRIRLLMGKDDAPIAALRKQAILEGLRMPLAN